MSNASDASLHEFRKIASPDSQTGALAEGAPYHLGQISSIDGLGDIPPTVTLWDGEFAREVRCALKPWEIQPYDTVVWLPTDGLPVVIATVPGMGTLSLLAEDADEDDVEPWHEVGGAGEPAFAATWSNFGSVYAPVGFRKQTDGWVCLKGLALKSSGTGPSTIFTLPEGYRPEVSYFFSVSSANIMAQVRIDSNGNVIWLTDGDGTSYLSLDDVFFPTKLNRSALINPVLEDNWSGYGAGNPDEAIQAYLRGDGWCWWTGVMRTATGTAGIRAVMRIDSRLANNPVGKMIVNLSSSGNLARFDFGGSSDAGDRSPCRVIFANAGLVTAVVLGGTNYFTTSGAHALWIPATYQNSWATYPGDLGVPAAYHKDAHGMVHLQGLVDGGPATTDVIFTLPAGYRPLAQRVFKSNDSVNESRIDVTAAGEVKRGGGAGNTSYRTITGIKFYAEQ